MLESTGKCVTDVPIGHESDLMLLHSVVLNADNSLDFFGSNWLEGSA